MFFSDELLEKIVNSSETQAFVSLVLDYNKIHNITGAKNKSDVLENVKDSIYALKYLEFYPKNAIDIGSGAGFPALPLALSLRDCHFTLYEPIAKKSAFLHLAKSELELSHLEIKTERIEKTDKFTADFITSRAVGDINLLLKLSNGFFDENTTFLLYKGENAKQEFFEFENVRIEGRKKRKYVFLKGLKNVI